MKQAALHETNGTPALPAMAIVKRLTPAQRRREVTQAEVDATHQMDLNRAKALAVRKQISDKNYSVMIGGNEHVKIEGWTIFGQAFNRSKRTVPEHLTDLGADAEGRHGYRAYCEVLDGERRVCGGAFGECGLDEPHWVRRPRYEYVGGKRSLVGHEDISNQQRRSMAETRAGSKALSAELMWAAQMVGYASTPADELNPGATTPKSPGAPRRGRSQEPIGAAQLTALQIKYKASGKTAALLAKYLRCDEAGLRAYMQILPKNKFQPLCKFLTQSKEKAKK